MEFLGAPTESLLSSVSRIDRENKTEFITFLRNRLQAHYRICSTSDNEATIRRSQGAVMELELLIKIFEDTQLFIDALKQKDTLKKAEDMINRSI